MLTGSFIELKDEILSYISQLYQSHFHLSDVDAGKQFDWDSLYHVFWVSCPSISNTGPPPSPLGPEKHSIYCPEAASVLLSMARMVCGKVRPPPDSYWEVPPGWFMTKLHPPDGLWLLVGGQTL